MNNKNHPETIALSKVELNEISIAGLPCLRLKLGDVTTGITLLTPERICSLVHLLKAEHNIRLMTIEGIPGSFCEGLDLGTLASPEEKTLLSHTADSNPAKLLEQPLASLDVLTQFAELLSLIEQMPWPVIALVDGRALGGGLGLATAADLVLASPQASFGLPETLMGLIPAMVLPPIIRRIGLPKARLLALGSKPLSVTQAFESGLVDEVVDDLEVALAHHARRFSRMDPHAIGIVKTLVSSYFTTSPAGYQASASLSFLELLTSEETLKRLVRFNAGDPPWPEKNAS